MTPSAFSPPPRWHWQFCDAKHCAAVWSSLMISSSRNPQKCCPSYFGEQSLMPCTLIFIPGLKSMQEDGQILPEVVHGMFRNLSFPYAFNGDGAETGHNLPFSSSASRRQRHERVNTPTSQPPANPLFPTTFSFPLLSGKTVLPPPMALFWITSYTGLFFGFQHTEARN